RSTYESGQATWVRGTRLLPGPRCPATSSPKPSVATSTCTSGSPARSGADVSTFDADSDAARLRAVQDAQGVHRRLLKAKDEGTVPDPADVAAAAILNASPYRHYDRINPPDPHPRSSATAPR